MNKKIIIMVIGLIILSVVCTIVFKGNNFKNEETYIYKMKYHILKKY